MAHNRLLNFHIVRSTRPVTFTPTSFLPPTEQRTPRDPLHAASKPDYPDSMYYLNITQKYLFRSVLLRHLRVEQFNRYFALTTDEKEALTLEDTMADEDDEHIEPCTHHRHYDANAEAIAAGTIFPSTAKSLESARKRQHTRLGISRTPFIEPIGAARETFYESRLLSVLPWYCYEKPSVDGVWTFCCELPDIIGFSPHELKVGEGIANSFEHMCANMETQLCQACAPCACCTAEMGYICKACRFAMGFHRCQNAGAPDHVVWRKGSLHGGQLDIERAMFNLHRKGLPVTTLRDKADEYVAAELLTVEKARQLIRVLEAERSVFSMANDEADDTPPNDTTLSFKMKPEQLAAELQDRENKMQIGATAGGVTDQWRVYQFIVGCICRKQYLRLMVQASAGTGQLINIVLLYNINNSITAHGYCYAQVKASSLPPYIYGAS